MFSRKGVKKIILSKEAKGGIFCLISEPYELIQLDKNHKHSLVKKIENYLNGDIVTFSDPVDTAGATKFQQKVWNVTRDIPYGETRSYAWISQRLGYNKRAARAVGQALGKNPIPIIIPCHRVIGSGRNLVGFSLGLELKKYLLDLECRKSN